MANGDAAAAAGMDVVPGASDLRDGYDEINKTRDYLANHQVSGTHDASAINAGTLAEARIPDLPGSKISSSVASADTADHADGPTSAAYNRGSTGSSWFSVWMNSSLQFMRNTSSRRFKQNIRDWAKGSAVLGLRTVMFDRRGKDTPNDEVGFIAEEVLEVLPEAVVYFDGKVDGIDDRTILAAIVALCQDQQRQLDELRARLDGGDQ